LGDEQYQLNWTVPVSSNVFYRIMVHAGNVVTTKLLGIADVETASNASQLKNVNADQFVTLVDGQTLPIKFRIERYALCEVPGVGPCTSAVVNLAGGGTVTTTLPGGTAPSGVTVPPQSPTAPAVTITVQSCPSLNPRAIDLPVFGPCVRVTADPPLPPSGLTTAATVFVCDIGASITIGGNVVSADQKERITLHRLDVDGFGQHVTALPHATACGGPTAAAGASVKGFFASLAHGRWKSASRHLLGLIGPKSLYAARRIDGGGGGDSEDFSDFQFALPAKMAVSGGDGQTALFGTRLPIDPAVVVTDLAGTPVANATVHFSTGNGSLSASSDTTDVNGIASVHWTIKGTAGANSMVASGRGIAGGNVDGPRSIFDPFMPIQNAFDPGSDPIPNPLQPVLLHEGNRTFAATSLVPSNDQLAVGDFHACVIGTGGSTACWGSRSFAQLGDGTPPPPPPPPPPALPPPPVVSARVAVSGSPAFTKIASRGSHTCGTTTTGAILCWGRNQHSNVTANGTQSLGVPSPTPVGGGLYSMISPARLTTCGLTTANVAVCWGLNQAGEVGDGTTVQRLTPVPVLTNVQFSSIQASWLHGCALTSFGAAYCWGAFNGQLAQPVPLANLTPVPIAGGHVFTRLYSGGTHTCGLTATGEAWCWGDNVTGQLGDGTAISGGPPVHVSGGLLFSVLGTGTTPNSGGRSHTCGIALNGTAYCWGFNDLGQLGDGTTTARLLPTPVLTSEVFVAIGAGDRFTCAMTPDRRVFCWGGNLNGELGSGTAGGMSLTPVLVP
jgi:alpha-tubulin suppressor-like RCC1 family protein